MKIVLFKAHLSTCLGVSAAWVQSMKAASIPVLYLVLRDQSGSNPKLLGRAGKKGLALLLLYGCCHLSRPLSCQAAWFFSQQEDDFAVSFLSQHAHLCRPLEFVGTSWHYRNDTLMRRQQQQRQLEWFLCSGRPCGSQTAEK